MTVILKTLKNVEDRQTDAQLLPTEGEIHYLWWFMQGSIMDADVRKRLLSAWGFCQRHAWIALLVEAAFRHSFLMGPAIVYEDIMGSAVKIIEARSPMKDLQILSRFRERGRCIVCDNVPKKERPELVRHDLVEQGRDTTELCRFAVKTHDFWEAWVCGRCLGSGKWPRCRKHLMEDAKTSGIVDITKHRAMIHALKKHITAYSNGFRWELRGTATTQDMAAMIGCVGWCSGWKPLLDLIGIRTKKTE